MKLLLFGFLLFSLPAFSQEICDNGIDDDGDGLIDLNDALDCQCDNLVTGSEVVSLIPNASFEEMECCPDGLADLTCATTWIQASQPTSDYYNTCGFTNGFVPEPLPDGDGCVGVVFNEAWSEYVGACTDDPILETTNYLMSFNVASLITTGSITFASTNDLGPVEIVLFGSPDCSDLPFAGLNCPMESGDSDWEVIGSAIYNPSYEWSTVTFSVNSSVDINAIALGPSCDLPDAYNDTFYAYFLFDNLILNEAGLFTSALEITSEYSEEYNITVIDGSYQDPETGQIQDVGPICSDQTILSATTLESGATNQWFYEGIAISGETNVEIILEGDDIQYGDYQFMVSTSDGCASSFINLPAPTYPTAEFSIETACFPNPVNFTDESVFNLGFFDWVYEFDDGGISTFEPNPEYTYNVEGDYEVTLTTVATNFCTDSYQQQVIFELTPIANFIYDPNCVGELVQFDEDASIGGGLSLVDWDWDFGDGNTTSNASNTTHAYNAGGFYDVTLTVEGSNGCVDEQTLSIEIYADPVAEIINEAVCLENPEVFFIDNSTSSSGSVNSWVWNFGDGNSSIEQNPSHLYTSAGQFDVTLAITSEHGCGASTTAEQFVSELDVEFQNNSLSGCSPYCNTPEVINNTPEFDLVEYHWEFSNGETSNSSFPTVCFDNNSFTENAYYDVSLTVKNEVGCAKTIHSDDMVTVWPSPIAEFSLSADSLNILDAEVSTTNTSKFAETYFWDFGNGDYYDDFEPTHRFDDALIYHVLLTAINEFGCIDTAQREINILPDFNIYIPNAFTPDGDGINDVFQPSIYGGVVEDYYFEVINRWGEVVFSTINSTDVWTGESDSNPENYSEDEVYIWNVYVKFKRIINPYVASGNVLIVR